jgi:hypothetical protein
MGFLVLNTALLTANAQTKGGDQIYVNQPYDPSQPSNIVPPASFAQQQYPYAEPYMNGGGCAPSMGMPYAEPYACGMPMAAAPCAVPCAAPCVAPYTAGYSYSTQQSSAFGPFTPPVTQASEQFYQYPGLTPYGAYPGAGYAAMGGVGYDPMSGYYGPYGGYTPLI